MANEPIKRLRYFTGQFLEAVDFEAEQHYHIDMRHRGKRALYSSAGIIDDGLRVTPKTGDAAKIAISAGIAVDGQGRELVLVDGVTESLPAAGSTSQTYFVTLKYDQQETDEQTPGDQDISDTTRYQERPKVEFFTSPSGFNADLAIVLARVTVDTAGHLSGPVDTTVRQAANGRFPRNLTVGQGGNGVLKTRHIDGKSGLNDDKDDLFLNWNTETNVNIGFGEGKKSALLVSGNLGVGTGAPENAEGWGRVADVVGTGNSKLSVRTGQIDARVQAHESGWWGSRPGLVIGTKTNHTLSLGTAGETRLTIDTAGNVGIGTTSPVEKLEVAGNLIVRSPDNNIYSLKFARTDEANRLHQWAFWHMNNQHRKNSLEIWEYKQDSQGRDCGSGANPNDGAMCAPRLVIAEGGNVGIGTTEPKAKLQVSGGAIMPTSGNSENAGILFPKDVFGGAGDAAWIRYYARQGENTTLEIGTSNDAGDHIALMPSGGVGIGTNEPGAKLHVVGNAKIEGTLSWGGDHVDTNYVVLGRLLISWGTLNDIMGFHENIRLVNFGRAFSSTPVVTVTLEDPGWGTYDLQGGVGAYEINPTDFKILFKTNSRNANRRLSFYWIAIGMA